MDKGTALYVAAQPRMVFKRTVDLFGNTNGIVEAPLVSLEINRGQGTPTYSDNLSIPEALELVRKLLAAVEQTYGIKPKD